MSKLPFHQSLFIAARGFLEAVSIERNLRIQVVIALIVVAAGLFFQITLVEWVLITLCISAVITAELMNTAVEMMTDLLQPELHEKARKVKDFSAASVLIASSGAAITGIVIFIPYVVEWF